MSRKNTKEINSVLSRPIIVRLNEDQYSKLEKLRIKSNSRSLGVIIRKMLDNKPVKLLHKDISMNGPMEELALIRKEIKSIGVNINQQTHRFHVSTTETERSFHSIKTAETYKTIEPKIDRLMVILSKLAEKWLQK
ncbi:mobilization protein [Pedobacter gandavensis]|uniref:Mobilization protein n=1 Tax=Pedobacter gandavensis TaxID=2679963 RepID=A0ABR6EUM5_9SPHI|nr:mobilization protein [Pedobacter gandavensis]MBB2148969.1 mobilization protein [Pedobacter gandavensis]